jgi:serine/threonine-protein kinase
MDADRNLLFGVLALQGDLIDDRQFAEGCTAWAGRKDRPLSEFLLERGWIVEDDRRLIEQLLERKLKKHSGDAHLSLVSAAATDAEVGRAVDGIRQTLRDDEIQHSLADIPQPDTVTGTTTIDYLHSLSHTPQSRDRYTLTTMHAKGGIGQVWLAHDANLDRDVALKELRPEQQGNDAILRRFLLEAKITSRLDHPGVVPVFELGRAEAGTDASGRPFYTMRFIDGRTLTNAVADYHRQRAEGTAGRVELLKLSQAFVSVCNTVAYAHSKGVIHRDLKGMNIVLGSYGEVILLDWGLAKLVDESGGTRSDESEPEFDPMATALLRTDADNRDSGLTVAGQALGTPAFMAPEQADGRLDRIGRRTDVYGLGAILYEILTGKPPFGGSSTVEVLRKVREEAPTPPSRLDPKVPRALEAICLKALAKEPEQRYNAAADLAVDVQHWLADEPVSAWREPLSVKLRRWISRNRTPVAAGVAALAVAAVALGVLLASQTRANTTLMAALERESMALGYVDERFGLAQRAIESFYRGASEDVILRRPELTDLRQKLLATSLSFYQQMTGSLENSLLAQDKSQRIRDVALGLERVASIQAVLGKRDEAIATRKKIVSIYETLPGQGPQSAAQQLRELANVERLAGRPDDSLKSFQRSLELFRQIDADGNQQMEIARSESDMGLLLKDIGRFEAARKALENARRVFQESLQRSPGTYVVERLASTATALGNLQLEAGRWNDALAYHEEASRLYESRLAGQPKSQTYYPAEFARSLNNLGLCLCLMGKPEEGRQILERGRKIREQLLSDQPLNIDFRGDLARSEYHLTLADLLAKRPQDALIHLRKAEELYTGVPPKAPEDWYYQACLLSVQASLVGNGQPEAKLTPAERDERSRTANAAMKQLREAVAHGYRNHIAMKNDFTLDGLRSRPDFQELIRSLEAENPSS